MENMELMAITLVKLKSLEILIICSVCFLVSNIILKATSSFCEHHDAEGERIVEYENPERQYLPFATYICNGLAYVIILFAVITIFA